MNRRWSMVSLFIVLAACRLGPPAAPFLTAEEQAVVVVRPTQETALAIARACEPVGAAEGRGDAVLRQTAVRRGANVVEVLYDAQSSSAVLHTCPVGFDAALGMYPVPAAATAGAPSVATTATP
jgi:hypothetical protein